MRPLAFVCLAVILGFLLGRWAPSEDLHRARKRIEDLDREVRRGGGRSGADPMAGVNSLLRIRDAAPAPAPASTNATATAEAAAGAPGETNQVRRARERDPRDLRERIDEAKRLWETRSDLARSSFLNNLQAADPARGEHHVAFDVMVEAMNRKMEQRIGDWVGYVKEKGDMRPEDGARLMHALTGAAVETYDEFDRKLPPTWRDAAGEEFMMFDFVNPRVGEKFLEIEDILERDNRRQRRPPL